MKQNEDNTLFKDRGDLFERLSGQVGWLVFLNLVTSRIRYEWIPLGVLSPYVLVAVMAVPAMVLICWVWRSQVEIRQRDKALAEPLDPTYRRRRTRLKRWIFAAYFAIASSWISLYLEVISFPGGLGWVLLWLAVLMVLVLWMCGRHKLPNATEPPVSG